MDKTLVCGTETPGSTPGESTNEIAHIGLFHFALNERLGVSASVNALAVAADLVI